MNATDFVPGTVVYGSDQQEIGKVAEVWALTSQHGALPVSRGLLRDYGPVRGTRELFEVGQGCLQIRRNDRSDETSPDLFVSLTAICTVERNGSVILRQGTRAYHAPLAAAGNILAPAA